MDQLTIVMLHSGTDKDLQQLKSHLPALEDCLNKGDAFWGRKVKLEVLDGYLRTLDSSKKLAEDLAKRDDVVAVSFWGGAWLGPVASKNCVQTFLEESLDQPFIVLSGTVCDEHRRHPGSFSLAPALRDKETTIKSFVAEFPAGTRFGFIAKESLDDGLMDDCIATDKQQLCKIILPKDFPHTEPEEKHFHQVCSLIENAGRCDVWLLSVWALNKPLRAWLKQNYPEAKIMSVNSGKKLDWFQGDADTGDIFFGQDNDREKLDIILSNELNLDDDLPRIRVDSLLLLKKAAELSPCLDKNAPRQEIFENLRKGMLSIDGKNAVFEGTKFCFWFDPETRKSLSGSVCLKWRTRGDSGGILYQSQYRLDADGVERRVPVVYLNIDMLAIEKVDISQNLFTPTFYLDLRSTDNITLEDLFFVNAVPGSINTSLLINYKEQEDNIDFFVRRYKVSGNFNFETQLANYPLDTQCVDIEIAPTNPLERDILLQPPPKEKQDLEFDISGWDIKGGEISSHTRFWYLPTSSKFQMQFRAYRAASFAWALKRQSIDTVFRIGIPLSILLFISYFPVLSKQSQSSEMTGLLITSLLATIALYFSTVKPATDRLTLLDRVFRSSYVAIGLLLATILIATHLPENIYMISMKVWAGVYPLILLVEGWSSYKKYTKSAGQ